MIINYFFIPKIEDESIVNHFPFGRGWGNGYLVFKKGHPLYKKEYDEINSNESYPYAHGGWTFSTLHSSLSKKFNELVFFDGPPFLFEGDDWIIGFDTSHLDDSERNWPKQRVISHTKELASFFEKEENFI
jgi:hypothetical protein